MKAGVGSARDDLALAAGDARHLYEFAQVLRQHHVRERAEHGDQLGDVDELREARHRPVLARGLQFEFGRRVAEGGRPRVELVQAALAQRRMVHQPLHGEHFAERVGNRRAGSEHERAAGVLHVDVAGLHV